MYISWRGGGGVIQDETLITVFNVIVSRLFLLTLSDIATFLSSLSFIFNECESHGVIEP